MIHCGSEGTLFRTLPRAATGIFIMHINKGLQFGKVIAQADRAEGVFIVNLLDAVISQPRTMKAFHRFFRF